MNKKPIKFLKHFIKHRINPGCSRTWNHLCRQLL